jgi:hypothetical protein
MDCSGRYVSNTDYFTKLKKSFTDKVANAFHYFLINLDISKFDLTNIPQSKIKDELIERSIPDVLYFLKTFISKNNGNKYSSDDMWFKYINYCEENHSSMLKKRTFLIYCSRYMKKNQQRFKNKRIWYYLCNFSKFKQLVLKINHIIFSCETNCKKMRC